VGGITFTEIAALRFIAKEEAGMTHSDPLIRFSATTFV
jgi:hypothetical protein